MLTLSGRSQATTHQRKLILKETFHFLPPMTGPVLTPRSRLTTEGPKAPDNRPLRALCGCYRLSCNGFGGNRLRRKVYLVLVWLLVSSAFALGQTQGLPAVPGAQPTAQDNRGQDNRGQPPNTQDISSLYRDAQDALSRSLRVFGSDRVEALDTLRYAGTLLPEITRDLEPALRQGLTATVRRAEEAIVNQSETDFAVQRAVLGGGLQRALYEAALESLEGGDAPRARELLEQLAGDLSLRPTTFEDSPQTLQYTFERRLAARSLAQLDALPVGDQSRAYRGLARLYGDLLTVQGSLRLPPGTTAALLGAVDSVVTSRPLDEPLAALRGHLSAFADDAQKAYAMASDEPTATPPESTASNAGADPTNENDESAATNRSKQSPEQGRTDQSPPLLGEQPPAAFAVGTDGVTGEAGNGAGATGSDGETAPSTDLTTLLLALTGVLALVAGIRAAGLTMTGRAPWQNTALTLLLIPAVLEGAGALAPLARRLTADVAWFDVAWFASLERLSVSREPALQLVWALLVALAVLCLARGWRVQPQPTRGSMQGNAESEGEHAAPKASGRPAAPSVSVHARPTTTTNLDWDEDF